MSRSPRTKNPAGTPREAAAHVVQTLQDAGHEALFAGGCVRDMLLGVEPKDFDVATSARPEQVVKLFRRTQQVGAKFGVVLVHTQGHTIEVATFRRDMDYSDGRRPDAVTFTDAREDAQRRDFTINGMFFEPSAGKVVDYVGGQDDLVQRNVRAIGEPDRRFAEDHLRLLRAVRFAARLNFTIEEKTRAAIVQHADQLSRISPERIRAELEAIFTHVTRARGFELLCDCKLVPYLYAGANELAPFQSTIRRHLERLPALSTFEETLAATLDPLPGVRIGDACNSLRCSNSTRRSVAWLHESRCALDHPDRLTLADLKLLMAHPDFTSLLHVVRARLEADASSTASLDVIEQRAAAIAPADVAPPPLLDGNTLIEMGLEPGPRYKEILDRVYYMQLNGDITTPAAARQAALDLISAQ